MAHDILLTEIMDGDVVNSLQDADGRGKAGALAVGQVGLREVTRHHHLGAKAQAGEEHFDLLGRGVLRLVEDDEGIIQGASAHIGKRCDLDHALFHEALVHLRPQHLTGAS